MTRDLDIIERYWMFTTVSLIRTISTVIVAITTPANGHTAAIITAEITQRVTGQLICIQRNVGVNFVMFNVK